MLSVSIALLSGVWVGPARAQVFYVDNQSASCSNSGPGTEAQPYCSIAAAATAHKGPGVTILVKPGVYRESVTVPVSGASGNPYVFQALGPGVVLDGADAYDNPAQWTSFSGNVWRASSVTWPPDRVYVDGVPIDSTSDAPAAIPAYTFRYVAGEGLYVNLDGDNPGTHATFVGRRNNAFNLPGRSWVTIDGFEITRTEDRAIRLQTGCSNVVVARNRVTFANNYGIHTVGGVNLVIEENTISDCTFHGIGLTAGATGCIVRGNESFGNAKPGVRVANGIYLYGSPGNTLYRNRCHGNQDTGIQIQSGSNDCLAFDNISWNNGDHGFDHLGATGTRHFNDVACGNFKDGFSIEGLATGTQLTNCIAINNGVNTNEFNLWIDAGSVSGFVSDYNVFWNSTAQPPIKYISTSYATIAAYQSASGQDPHSIQADPQFVNPATGDFHVTIGSPAIDSGTSGQADWPPLDADGHPRVDIPAVPNTGAGPVPFTDRGAFEYSAGSAPIAALTLEPAGGTAPLSVTADASASTDNGTIVAYRFDFGDGTIVGPQPQPIATHTMGAGSWTVTVTVTDDDGLTASTGQSIIVTSEPGPPPVAALTLQPTSGTAPLAVTADASGSSDNGAIVSYRFDFGDGTIVGPQPQPTATHTLGAGSWTVTVTVTDNDGLTGSTGQPITVSPPIGPQPIAALTLQPTTGIEPLSVTADASASTDPNGVIVTYQFDFGDGTIVGPQPESTATHTLSAGSWTVTVTVTDNDGLTSTASQSIIVDAPPPFVASLTLTPSTGNTPVGVTAVASASGGILGNSITTYSFDMGNGATFGPQNGSSATAVYTPGTYTVSVTVQNDAGQTASTTRQVIVAETGPGPNLVGNPSFESDASGWLPVSATITKVPGGFDGSSKLRVQGSGSGTFGIGDGSNWVDTTLAAGTRYRFRAWVRSEAGQGSVRIRVREYNSNGKQVAPPRHSDPVTLSPIWKLVTVDYVCEAADNNIDFRILDTPVVSGEVMEVDNVMVNIVLGTSTLAVDDVSGGETDPSMFPNPMRDRGAIRFTLERSGPLKVELFDVAGRRVKTLLDRLHAPAAPYELPFDGRATDGRRLAPGLYLYRVQALHGTVSGRFVVVR